VSAKTFLLVSLPLVDPPKITWAVTDMGGEFFLFWCWWW
jgi:hypothetical protein